MDSGVHGHLGQLVQRPAAKMQPNIRQEHAVILHRSTVLCQCRRLFRTIDLLLCTSAGGAGCVGVGINITNCTELADCPGIFESTGVVISFPFTIVIDSIVSLQHESSLHDDRTGHLSVSMLGSNQYCLVSILDIPNLFVQITARMERCEK